MIAPSETIGRVLATVDALNWRVMSPGERAIAESTISEIAAALDPLDLPMLEVLCRAALVFRGDPRPDRTQQSDKVVMPGAPPSVVDVRQQIIKALSNTKSS
jgi:hypothetical protein